MVLPLVKTPLPTIKGVKSGLEKEINCHGEKQTLPWLNSSLFYGGQVFCPYVIIEYVFAQELGTGFGSIKNMQC